MDRRQNADWSPGSFTKNFSWGAKGRGLVALHEHIRVGFADQLEPVSRAMYKDRTAHLGRPSYIATNFFLYNSRDYLLPDELVFQAVANPYNADFDKLAIFALNLSLAGHWRGARDGQSWPSLWAHYYATEVLSGVYGWDISKISADDIQKFLDRSPRYKALGSKKLSTNLNYMYHAADLAGMQSEQIDKWWVNAYFLALDRISEEVPRSRGELEPDEYDYALESHNFRRISGRWSFEKEIAQGYLAILYAACGGRRRLSSKDVEALTHLTIPDVSWVLAEPNEAAAAFHPTNVRTWKTIPTVCAQLAKHAGFEVVPPAEIGRFDAEAFIRSRTKDAIRRIAEFQIKPLMTADELDDITGGE